MTVQGLSFGMRSNRQHRQQPISQPEPFTPGLAKAAVRQHAFEMFRDKLPDHPLTLEDWVLAEKDLANSLDSENMPK